MLLLINSVTIVALVTAGRNHRLDLPPMGVPDFYHLTTKNFAGSLASGEWCKRGSGVALLLVLAAQCGDEVGDKAGQLAGD